MNETDTTETVKQADETPAEPTRLTAKEALLNVGRFFRFLGVRVVLNIIFSPVIALILLALGFLWTTTFGLPGNVTTTPLLWMPAQLVSLAILGGLMWGAMEATRTFLCRFGLPLQQKPGRFLRLLTIGGWFLGSLGIGRLATFALPLIKGWNLSIWLAGFVAVELALYFAIELTLCRLFPRFKAKDEEGSA
ncbi:MAG: hypothetical protein ACPG40_00890 [Alphaproteobacteria bacterium]